mmetsp:Transcript_13362/g.32141  ORF Transcript_13362/g.32141 Transcript_13362/m.32141 type:complete len:267 (+) Transcript_13362:110-910(+)
MNHRLHSWSSFFPNCWYLQRHVSRSSPSNPLFPLSFRTRREPRRGLSCVFHHVWLSCCCCCCCCSSEAVTRRDKASDNRLLPKRTGENGSKLLNDEGCFSSCSISAADVHWKRSLTDVPGASASWLAFFNLFFFFFLFFFVVESLSFLALAFAVLCEVFRDLLFDFLFFFLDFRSPTSSTLLSLLFRVALEDLRLDFFFLFFNFFFDSPSGGIKSSLVGHRSGTGAVLSLLLSCSGVSQSQELLLKLKLPQEAQLVAEVFMVPNES